MKKLVVLGTIVLTVLCLISGCPQPQPEEPPSLAIMVEVNVVEVGYSFMVAGSNLDPRQKIWVEWDYRTTDGAEGVTVYYGEPDEEGAIHVVIDVPEDIVPGDYEVEVHMGKHLDGRELIATLPIYIKATEE